MFPFCPDALVAIGESPGNNNLEQFLKLLFLLKRLLSTIHQIHQNTSHLHAPPMSPFHLLPLALLL